MHVVFPLIHAQWPIRPSPCSDIHVHAVWEVQGCIFHNLALATHIHCMILLWLVDATPTLTVLLSVSVPVQLLMRNRIIPTPGRRFTARLVHISIALSILNQCFMSCKRKALNLQLPRDISVAVPQIKGWFQREEAQRNDNDDESPEFHGSPTASEALSKFLRFPAGEHAPRPPPFFNLWIRPCWYEGV